jgi:SAM-dependent methyltransferase
MTKKSEIDYLRNIGEAGIKHASGRPFSDISCAQLLMEIGAVMDCLPPPPAKLLDLGCGTGWTSLFFAKRGYDVVGQDIADDMIYFANQSRVKENIEDLRFVVGDFEGLNFENEFDCVVFYQSLHHSENEEKSIRMAYKALKEGGICVTSEPGIGHEKRPESINAVKKYDVTEKGMSPQKIIAAGKKAGFRLFKVYPHSSQLGMALYGEPKRPFLKKLFKLNIFRILFSFFIIGVYKRFSGIVVMIK